jgi:hypothetical protein
MTALQTAEAVIAHPQDWTLHVTSCNSYLTTLVILHDCADQAATYWKMHGLLVSVVRLVHIAPLVKVGYMLVHQSSSERSHPWSILHFYILWMQLSTRFHSVSQEYHSCFPSCFLLRTALRHQTFMRKHAAWRTRNKETSKKLVPSTRLIKSKLPDQKACWKLLNMHFVSL